MVQKNKSCTNFSNFIRKCVNNELILRPAPPGDIDSTGKAGLVLLQQTVKVDALNSEVELVKQSLSEGLLDADRTKATLKSSKVSDELSSTLIQLVKETTTETDWDNEIEKSHKLNKLALIATKIIDRGIKSLLNSEPLREVHFSFTDKARACLAIAWEAMVERGTFPLPPLGSKRFEVLRTKPCGAMHFVSASDLDAGYFYVMGISQSPEAQSLQTTDVAYGLDGELIVPGQAVSPIPPFLAMATRLFAASIPTSSNISEEVHSIPMRNFPHPINVNDLEPHRGGIRYPVIRPRDLDEAITELKIQFNRNKESKFPDDMPKVMATFDVTGMTSREISHWLENILLDKELSEKRKLLALYLNVEDIQTNRVERINSVVNVASEFGLKYVAVTDDAEDSMLPDLLEYLSPNELNDVANFSDSKKVIVIDGRPIDPVYTASTASQRIQSVFTTFSVDILKMGMWLCLDAMTARRVWSEITRNPHFPRHMLLMPIGIVEPWDAFVDNRDSKRTSRAILDPFEKIKFMIEEAEYLGVPSLLTDTRHKEKWVLLGRKSAEDGPHVREKFIYDKTGAVMGRTDDSAIPLLSWNEFMQCEKLARQKGIVLGQAGSIEGEQVFRIISETTYDAAHERRNPATAIWTAETERVLRTRFSPLNGDLQKERSSEVSPFLAVVNRGIESHAKLDGWLRFLEDRGVKYGNLKKDLEEKRRKLADLLEKCLEKQHVWKISSDNQSLRSYQEAWNNYRKEYVIYHNMIKESFAKVRTDVELEWRSMSPKERKLGGS